MGIGRKIRAYRLKKGWKVGQLASIIGVSQGSLSDIENEKTRPAAGTIESLVRHTDIDAAWLLGAEGAAAKESPLIVAEESAIYGIRLDPDLAEILRLLKDYPQDQLLVLKLLRGKREIKEALEGLEVKKILNQEG